MTRRQLEWWIMWVLVLAMVLTDKTAWCWLATMAACGYPALQTLRSERQ